LYALKRKTWRRRRRRRSLLKIVEEKAPIIRPIIKAKL
jgi:hypothetical protein